MSKRKLALFSGLVAILLTGLACNLSLPAVDLSSSLSATGTAVAATVMALAPAAAVTPDAHALPVEPLSSSPIRVSFVSTSRNLYVWSDGTAAPFQLTTSEDVTKSVVSPDGALIAFTRCVDYTICQVDVINADGTNQRTLLTSDQIDALPRSEYAIASVPSDMRWIPGTHKLALNFYLTFEGPGSQNGDSLYILDADSGAFSNLITVGNTWGFTISPDATKILISRPEGIDLYGINGSLLAADVITYPFVNTASEYAWNAHPVWKTDSSAFAVGIITADPWASNPDVSTLYLVGGTGATILSWSHVMSFTSQQVTSFDPELTKVAYAVQIPPQKNNIWELHLSNIDGTADTILANGYFSDLPDWSPDGTYYIFSNKSDAAKLAYIGSSTAVPTVLSDIISLEDIRWLDNTRYVASSSDGNSTSLLLGTVGNPTGVIFNDPGFSAGQAFSFDVNR